MNWFKRRSVPAPAPAPEPGKIKASALSALGPSNGRELTPIHGMPTIEDPFLPAKPLFKADGMAMDDGFSSSDLIGHDFHEGIGFFGFGILAELSQRPEYRRMSETLAKEMTREWIQFVSTGDDADGLDFTRLARDLKQQFKDADPTDREALEDIKAQWASLLEEQLSDKNPKAAKLKEIAAEFKRLHAQEAFRRVAEMDGFFGRGHIYLDTGKTEDRDELATPLIIDRRKIRKKALKRLIVVDPTWTYPQDYNSLDPLRPDYYRPRSWFVMAKKVHASRLLTFIGRPMPDILKPAYCFSGLSLSQMAKPYVDNWLRTRQSVSDLIHSFSVPVLKTDLSTVLNGGDAEQVALRAEVFNRCRDNRGIFMLQKGMQEGDTGEEFTNVSVPISGLDKLQAQAQEQMAAVCGIPLVKLLGVTPSGLNASSDGEIRAFYDFVAAFQEELFRDGLETLLKIVQLSLFGEIDPEIGLEFEPLWQLDEQAQAAARKSDADIDNGYVDRGILAQKEVRAKIAADRKGPYASIDVDDVPEAPEAAAPDETGEDGGGEFRDAA
jgi:phage-related protein (TIGR01555 family)